MPVICWGNLAKAADDILKIEQSIQDYVEGHDENPNAHMGEDYALGAHRLQNILDHPYASVYPWHVYAIDAFSIATGALVVKGQGPYIVVQDPDDGERVRIYPEGIIVKKGNISVFDYMERKIFDAKGIVSETQFQRGTVTGAGTQSSISYTYEDITNLTLNFDLQRTSRVLFIATFKAKNEGDADDDVSRWFRGRIYLDDAQVGPVVQTAGELLGPTGGSPLVIYTTLTTHAMEEVAGGAHTVKLQMRCGEDNLPAWCDRSETTLSYLVLGT